MRNLTIIRFSFHFARTVSMTHSFVEGRVCRETRIAKIKIRLSKYNLEIHTLYYNRHVSFDDEIAQHRRETRVGNMREKKNRVKSISVI